MSRKDTITLQIDLKRKYNWDKTEEKGRDALLFSRKEGHEVLLMIQSIVDEKQLGDQAEVYRIENLIANDLPGEIRKKTAVKDWLLGKMAPENPAITFLKTMPGLGTNSESSVRPETFSIPMELLDYSKLTSIGDRDLAGDVLQGLEDLARRSSMVRSYGTYDQDYDPNIDYFELHGYSPLFPNPRKKQIRQGWYTDVDPFEYAELLINFDRETYEEDTTIGQKLIDKFDEETNGLSAIAIYNNPDPNKANGSVYIWGGIDPASNRLVGFMAQQIMG